MAGFRKLVETWRQHLRHPKFIAGAIIVILFGLFWIASWQTLDPDFGWHLAAGNYIILHHWTPAHDIYTYSARSYRWIDHEWGNDVILSIFYRLGGYGLVATVFTTAWTFAICLFRRKLRLGILLLAAIALLPYVGIRPTVWTVLGVALLLELAGRTTKRAKILIPFLVLIWANLHGGFIIGLALIFYFFLRNRRLDWLIILTISIFASCINPYGPRLYIEVAHTLFDPALHKQITEWRSFFLEPSGWLFIGLWAIGFGAFDRAKLRNWLDVTPLLAIASLSASRNLPLFIVSSLRDIDRYVSSFKPPKRFNQPERALAITTTLLIAIIAIYSIGASYLPWESRYASYPVQEVAYLQTHHCSGNLFNDYSYGGYLIWKLPSTPVYIDGRMPTWHDANGVSYVDRYEAILHSNSAQYHEFSEYHVHCALLARTTADERLQYALSSKGWYTASTGNDAILLLAPTPR